MAPRLLLASTSRYRALLLERLGLPFGDQAPGIDESARPGEAPRDAGAPPRPRQGQAVHARHPEACVIGSDQVAISSAPPRQTRRCRRIAAQQLAAFERQARRIPHRRRASSDPAPRTGAEHVDRTIVRFRKLTDREISRYVEIEQPFDCAGCFRSEGLGVALFESIENARSGRAGRASPHLARRCAARRGPRSARGARSVLRSRAARAPPRARPAAAPRRGTPSPVSGQRNATDDACRNIRLRPSARSRALKSRSPYFSSPATGWPAKAACTRIW